MIFFASKSSNILDNKDTATLFRKEAAGMEIVRSVSKEKPEISVEIKLPATVDGVKVRRAVREARIAIRRLTDRKIKIRYKYSAKVF